MPFLQDKVVQLVSKCKLNRFPSAPKDKYHDMMLSSLFAGDDYTSTWTSSSPLFPLAFIASYVLFHYLYVPNYELPLDYRRKWTLVKNTVILIANAVLGVAYSATANKLEYSMWCQPVNPAAPNKTLDHNRMKDLMFYFSLVKMLEASDTIVISLRGGRYPFGVFVHHAIMIALGWAGTVFVPAGTSIMISFYLRGCYIALLFQ
ncbi:uncharacterized protein LOC118434700 [Folsomia candida]|uniref:uncharacterized protein LOC118434700 n=1 Tax=Folsomia candida TaxID=158441 RepID=UPI001604AD4C|nr:uncharacterized protein LOC118434700 [Folsomia candida]